MSLSIRRHFFLMSPLKSLSVLPAWLSYTYDRCVACLLPHLSPSWPPYWLCLNFTHVWRSRCLFLFFPFFIRFRRNKIMSFSITSRLGRCGTHFSFTLLRIPKNKRTNCFSQPGILGGLTWAIKRTQRLQYGRNCCRNAGRIGSLPPSVEVAAARLLLRGTLRVSLPNRRIM